MSKRRRGKFLELEDGRQAMMYYDEQTVEGKLLLHVIQLAEPGLEGKMAGPEKISLSLPANIKVIGFFD